MRETRRVVNPNTVFEQVGISGGIPRSRFDLSNQVIGTQDMGFVYPVMARLGIPGDNWHLGQRTVVRWNPLLAPILHEINTYFYSFFVPMRLLDANWDEWFTGGEDGETAVTLRRWAPTGVANDKGSLWDWLGFPVDVTPHASYSPLAAPRDAYNLIYNEYFRDENLDSELLLSNESIWSARWEKDYFASALPWQQRGTAPALPISGTTSAVWPGSDFSQATTWSTAFPAKFENGSADPRLLIEGTGSQAEANALNMFNDNTVDLSVASTFDIADLRQAVAIQQLLELGARGGARPTEYLRAVYGTSPTDDRLQRPEYIGRVKMPLIFNEVLQTSATSTEPTPQGNLAGHGIGVVEGRIGDYYCQEFGVVMTLMCTRPRAVYTQGFDREWMPQSRYEVYNPLFANLSEQAILRGEIYATGVLAEDTAIWGYQGRYAEHRYARSRVCGDMHDTFDYWHLARQFASAPALNSSFLTYGNNIRKDILAAPTEPALMVSVGNHVLCDRPMPAVPIPGLGRL